MNTTVDFYDLSDAARAAILSVFIYGKATAIFFVEHEVAEDAINTGVASGWLHRNRSQISITADNCCKIVNEVCIRRDLAGVEPFMDALWVEYMTSERRTADEFFKLLYAYQKFSKYIHGHDQESVFYANCLVRHAALQLEIGHFDREHVALGLHTLERLLPYSTELAYAYYVYAKGLLNRTAESRVCEIRQAIELLDHALDIYNEIDVRDTEIIVCASTWLFGAYAYTLLGDMRKADLLASNGLTACEYAETYDCGGHPFVEAEGKALGALHLGPHHPRQTELLRTAYDELAGTGYAESVAMLTVYRAAIDNRIHHKDYDAAFAASELHDRLLLKIRPWAVHELTHDDIMHYYDTLH